MRVRNLRAYAHDWAVAKYKAWDISARNEKWGEWRGWERGITHIDMVYPRVQSLRGTQLAWNPSTSDQGVTAELITIPMVNNQEEFKKWLPNVKGKLVMISMKQPTGRPNYNWEEFATEESFEKMKSTKFKIKIAANLKCQLSHIIRNTSKFNFLIFNFKYKMQTSIFKDVRTQS